MYCEGNPHRSDRIYSFVLHFYRFYRGIAIQNFLCGIIYSYDKILNASELLGEVPESTHRGGGRYILGGGQIFRFLFRGKFLNPWQGGVFFALLKFISRKSSCSKRIFVQLRGFRTKF